MEGSAFAWFAGWGAELRGFFLYLPGLLLPGLGAVAGEPLRMFEGHTLPVQAVAYSPGGETVLTGGFDGTGRLWDADTGEVLTTVEHGAWVWSVAFAPDGGRFLTAGEDGVARVWDIGTGALVRTLEEPGTAVYAAAFSPDGARVATGGTGNRAVLWEVESGTAVRQFDGHEGWVRAIAFSPDGSRLLTGSSDQTARIWDAGTGAPTRTLTGHTGSVRSVAFSADGTAVVTGGLDGTARIWTVANGAEVRKLEEPLIHTVAFAPHDWKLVTGSQEGRARLWDARTGAVLRTYEVPGSPVTSLAFAPDGLRLLTGGGDNRARLWKTYSAELALSVTGELDFGRVIAGERLEAAFTVRNRIHVPVTPEFPGVPFGFSVEGDRSPLAAGASRQFTLIFSPLDEIDYSGNLALGSTLTAGERAVPVSGRGVLFEPFRVFSTEPPQELRSARFFPGQNLVATGRVDGKVRLWALRTGDLVAEFAGTGAGVNDIAVAPDGRTVLIAAGVTVSVWDTAEETLLRRFEGHEGPVASVRFSPDGRRVLSAELTRPLAILWDFETLEVRHRFQGPGNRFSATGFFPDGETVVLGSTNGTVRAWDAETGEVRGDFAGHDRRITELAVSPDGTRLLTASTDQTVRLWDTGSRTQLRSFEQGMGIVWSLEFSPDGKRFLTSAIALGVRLWDTETGTMLRVFEPESIGAGVVGFDLSGHRVASLNASGNVTLWDTVINPPGSFEDWATGIEAPGMRHPDAKPGGAGLPNLVRYALGYDADDPGPGVFPRVVLSGPGRADAVFTRRARRGDVVLHIDISEDLRSWTRVALADGWAPFVPAGDLPVEVVRDVTTSTVRVAPGLGSAPRFFRLRATRREPHEPDP